MGFIIQQDFYAKILRNSKNEESEEILGEKRPIILLITTKIREK